MTNDRRITDLWLTVQRLASAVGELAVAPPQDLSARREIAVTARRIALEVELAAGLVLVDR